MATVSKTVSLVGCVFDESDIVKVIAAIDAPGKERREALIARRDEIKRQKAARAKRKLAETDASYAQEIELGTIEPELGRIHLDVAATNVWGDAFNVHSLDELWDHVGRRELKKLEVRSHLWMTDSLNVGFTLDLDSNSEYDSNFRASGPVDLVRSISSNVDEVIKRRKLWWLRLGNQWYVWLLIALALWILITVESYEGLKHIFSGPVPSIVAIYGSMAVVALLFVRPVRLPQMLAPTVAVNGWGRFEPRRQALRYAAGGVAFALIATLIWSVVSGQVR
jgi:hypothetical protein